MTDPSPGLPDIDYVARSMELEERLARLEAETHTRLVHAELKTEAVRAGMVDLDGLKLLDLGKVELDETGAVKAAGLLMRDLRRIKPWLFGGDSSSSAAATPPTQPAKPKYATDMAEAEWRAARDELLKRRL